MSERGRGSPHSSKFFAATAALIGFGVGAVAVAAVLLASGSRSTSGATWSAWSPPDAGMAGEREIAGAVAPFYRASPASQLVIVTVHNANSASSSSSSGSASGAQIALRDPSTGSLGALNGTTAIYNLCGLGPGCAISTGTPSAARMLLLRRESLELALYTFKYISGTDNVLAVLPPGRGTPTQSLTPSPTTSATKSATSGATVDLAVLFQRASLARYLSQPLHDTLPEPLPPTVDEMAQAYTRRRPADLLHEVRTRARQIRHLMDGRATLTQRRWQRPTSTSA